MVLRWRYRVLWIWISEVISLMLACSRMKTLYLATTFYMPYLLPRLRLLTMFSLTSHATRYSIMHGRSSIHRQTVCVPPRWSLLVAEELFGLHHPMKRISTFVHYRRELQPLLTLIPMVTPIAPIPPSAHAMLTSCPTLRNMESLWRTRRISSLLRMTSDVSMISPTRLWLILLQSHCVMHGIEMAREWLSSTLRTFIGIHDIIGLPSTNSAMEALNCRYKIEGTLRKRSEFGQFAQDTSAWIHQRSVNDVGFPNQVTLSVSTWRLAYMRHLTQPLYTPWGRIFYGIVLARHFLQLPMRGATLGGLYHHSSYYLGWHLQVLKVRPGRCCMQQWKLSSSKRISLVPQIWTS